jgi:4-hydroxy-3-methylbut-2-enyl diphosphate reductase
MSDTTYVRKGFGLKAEVQDTLAADYTGQLVDMLRAREYTLTAGDTTVRLAKEFGFCYGVERAVDYAYQTRIKFPDKRIFLAGEIIHNPHVNAKLRERWGWCSSPRAARDSTMRRWSRRTWSFCRRSV